MDLEALLNALIGEVNQQSSLRNEYQDWQDFNDTAERMRAALRASAEREREKDEMLSLALKDMEDLSALVEAAERQRDAIKERCAEVCRIVSANPLWSSATADWIEQHIRALPEGEAR